LESATTCPGQVSGGTALCVNPNFYDVLLPIAMDQREILSDYDAEAQRLAVLPMVRP
jgi:hypothetical protein